MMDGVSCEGVRYQFLREEDRKVVYAKKVGYGAVTLQKSKTGRHGFEQAFKKVFRQGTYFISLTTYIKAI